MNHATPEQLNDYLDGSLSARERELLEEHLHSCERCADELKALRDTVEALGELPLSGQPRRDLWPGVAARTVERPITDLAAERRERRRPRVSLSLSQAVAAAAAVALLAGGSVWLALGGADLPEEVTIPARQTPHLVATPVGIDAYDRVVADLTRQLNQQADELEPETVATIQANLEIIDSAILEINEALARDPDNDYLSAYLARAMRKKVDVLRQASLVRARS